MPTAKRVLLVAEPGLAERFAHRSAAAIAAAVGEAIGDDVDIEVSQGALKLDADGQIHLAGAMPRREDPATPVIFLTELPRLRGHAPIPAEIDTEQMTGIISIPACGAWNLRKRVTRLAGLCVNVLLCADPTPGPSPAAHSRRLLWHIDEDRTAMKKLISSPRGGWLRIVLGMVRVNRPWRLVATLKGAIAAAAATASFGIFYTSIWQMASFLSPVRLTVISTFSVVLMSSWLILGNGLLEHNDRSGSRRQTNRLWDRLYNAVTLLTVASGVLTMYVGLYLLVTVAGLVVIDTAFLSSQIGADADLTSYLQLSWLATSMGVIAGALGSNADSYDSVLRAAYGQRERERRLMRDDDDRE